LTRIGLGWPSCRRH